MLECFLLKAGKEWENYYININMYGSLYPVIAVLFSVISSRIVTQC